ncbi:MAG: hypothetical protein EOO46_25195 [Flavobacterium sp.]|nr:MAG: hypothetical protein EOO46_25195 [Flavobacterium sp.]
MDKYFKHLIEELGETFTQLFSADGWVGKLIIAVAVFYAPVQLYAISIFMLIIMDVILGIWASRIKGEPFKSRTLRKGLIEKIALYGMLFTGCIIMGKILQSVFHYKTFFIAWVFTILIAVYELSSIVENIIIIKPELAFLNKLVSLLKKVEQKQLDSVEKKISDLTLEDEKKDKENNI